MGGSWAPFDSSPLAVEAAAAVAINFSPRAFGEFNFLCDERPALTSCGSFFSRYSVDAYFFRDSGVSLLELILSSYLKCKAMSL